MSLVILALVTTVTDMALIVWARAPLQSQGTAVVMVAAGLELSRVVTTPFVASSDTTAGAVAVAGAALGSWLGCWLARRMGWG